MNPTQTSLNTPKVVVATLGCVLLLTSGIVFGVGGVDASDAQIQMDDRDPGEPHPPPEGYNNTIQYYSYWSAIPDDVIEEYEELLEGVDEDDFDDADDVPLEVAVADMVTAFGGYVQPVGTYPTDDIDYFNTAALQRFDSPPNQTRYPDGADLEDGRWLEDVYIDTPAFTSSTRLYGDPSQDIIAPRFTAHTVTDYTYTEPSSEVSGERPFRSRTLYDTVDHGVEEYRVYVDGQLIRERQTSQQTTSISASVHDDIIDTIDNDSLSNGTTITVEADVYVDMRVREQDEVERCIGENCSRTRWVWETMSDDIETDEVTVNETTEVIVQDQAETEDTIEATYYNHPDGHAVVEVETHPYWSLIETEEAWIDGGYTLATDRNDNWDEIWTTDTNGSSDRERMIADSNFLTPFAYPTGQGGTPTIDSDAAINIVDVEVTEASTGQFPSYLTERSNIDQDTHGQVTGVTFETSSRAGHLGPDDTLVVHDLVGGTHDVELERSMFLNRSNTTIIETEVTERENQTDTITTTVRLTDQETGDPIDTSTRDGNVSINGNTVNTNTTGYATTTLTGNDTREGTVSVEYSPQTNPPSNVGGGENPTIYTTSSDFTLIRGWSAGVLDTLYTGLPVYILITIYGFAFYLFKRAM